MRNAILILYKYFLTESQKSVQLLVSSSLHTCEMHPGSLAPESILSLPHDAAIQRERMQMAMKTHTIKYTAPETDLNQG